MSQLFHDDGCVIANIRVIPCRVTFVPECEHTKIQSAEIIIDAESSRHALTYARTTLRLPRMIAVVAVEIGVTNDPQCACGHAFTDHSFYGATRIECHGKDTEPETMSCECGEYRPATGEKSA